MAAWVCLSFFAGLIPEFWLTVVMPFIMLVFLLKLTGIPYSEQQARAKKPDYAAYQAKTSAFIPWFPKK